MSLEITPAEAQEKVADGAQLIDVREGYEYEAGNIAEARHVELQQLSGQAETIDRDRPVVFQCRSGARSLMAAQAFQQAGFEAYSMAGGLQQWAAEGRPMQPDDAVVAEH